MRLAADVAFGFRLLRRSPGFAITAIVTLSLGVGVNVAMFSIVRAVLIEGLPYPDAGRVVTISQRVERVVQHDLSYDDLLAVRAGAPALAHLSGFVGPRVTVRGEGAPEHVAAHRVLPEYFDVFGVAPAVGRVFGAADFAAAPAIVVISESIWRSQFNARADVLGRTIRVDRVPLTVVGVMPASFDGHAGTQNATGVWMLWMPAPSDRAPIVEAVARVAPGQTIEIAHAQIAAAMKPRQPEFLELAEGQRFRFEGMSVVPVGAVEADRVRPGVILLQALAGFLLLMTCANLANVFLAHGASRRRELGVRVALGVGRARLVGQLLTEAAVIAAIGGALGALVAAGIVPIAVALAGEILPRGPSIGVSAPELAVGLALAGITALVFAGVPAWLASGADPLAAMRGTSHTAGHGVRAFRAGLVAAQVVFALVVLTSAGLLIRSFARVAVLPLGFDARGLVTGEFRLPTASASWREDARAFVRRLDGELRQRAGGLPITIASEMPYSQTTSSRTWQFMPADGSAAKAAGADIRVVASNYFDMLDIPVVRGRGFASTDVAGSDPVAVVNESFAREIGQGRDVIGARLDAGTPAFPVVTIVGVVADTRNGALALVPRRAAYTVLDQWPTERIAVALRGAATPIAATAMRDAVGSVDPEIPVINIDSIDRKIAGRERRRHFYLAVLTVFAALAGTLAAVGIYGVVTNVTGQRHREMGVRLALGASPRGLARMVVAGGLRPVWLGLGLGILAAWWTGRALQANREFRSQLYQISAQDPATIGIVAALLTTVAVFACWIPARRASMTSVVEVLKID